jgi:hypothetical protein
MKEIIFEKPVHISTESTLKNKKVGTFKVRAVSQKIKTQIGERITDDTYDKSGKNIISKSSVFPIYKIKTINHLPVVI